MGSISAAAKIGDAIANRNIRDAFTNGLNDGWSAGGFLSDLSTQLDLLVLNMPNGAHHSDLRHTRPCPGPDDTPDVLMARSNATAILRRWIAQASAVIDTGGGSVTRAVNTAGNERKRVLHTH